MSQESAIEEELEDIREELRQVHSILTACKEQVARVIAERDAATSELAAARADKERVDWIEEFITTGVLESAGKWRVGGKVPLNVYEDDKPMFQCHTPEDAVRVVALLNAADAATSELAAARKDTERLEWLTKSEWSVDYSLLPSDGRGWCVYLDHQGITDRNPEKYRFTARTLREAIDSARAAAPEAK